MKTTVILELINNSKYLEAYCAMSADWLKRGIGVDSVPSGELKQMELLRDLVVEQIGLTDAELTLINCCRKHSIFVEVNTFMRYLLEFRDLGMPVKVIFRTISIMLERELECLKNGGIKKQPKPLDKFNFI